MGKKNAHRFAPVGFALSGIGNHCSTNNADQNERQNSKHMKQIEGEKNQMTKPLTSFLALPFARKPKTTF